ncbi:hypothetical protein M422DRAFT_259680 [Sphaerobolus stellatus SS14]|uniref:Uncharacterized protein n=1 Tax=Sphaerobolus stellatus (strain SS14) TaxID=990650 RepID=A0A0C9U4F0_SPHS4|nr:hypothetical protein M422DRAFT_259680 [Sphaerobolus stellatus SS14]
MPPLFPSSLTLSFMKTLNSDSRLSSIIPPTRQRELPSAHSDQCSNCQPTPMATYHRLLLGHRSGMDCGEDQGTGGSDSAKGEEGGGREGGEGEKLAEKKWKQLEKDVSKTASKKKKRPQVPKSALTVVESDEEDGGREARIIAANHVDPIAN